MKFPLKHFLNFALPFLMLIASCSRHTTIIQKPVYKKDTTGVMYGCWVSRLDLSFKSRSDAAAKDIQYIEDYKLWLEKNYTFELQTRITTNDIKEHGTMIAGIYRIKSDTLLISINGYDNKIEQYIYKLDGDTLWFRPIKNNPITDQSKIQFYTRPVLQPRWDRN